MRGIGILYTQKNKASTTIPSGHIISKAAKGIIMNSVSTKYDIEYSDKVVAYLLTVLSPLALKPDVSSWKQQSRTGPPCRNSPLKTLALASYRRTRYHKKIIINNRLWYLLPTVCNQLSLCVCVYTRPYKQIKLYHMTYTLTPETA